MKCDKQSVRDVWGTRLSGPQPTLLGDNPGTSPCSRRPRRGHCQACKDPAYRTVVVARTRDDEEELTMTNDERETNAETTLHTDRHTSTDTDQCTHTAMLWFQTRGLDCTRRYSDYDCASVIALNWQLDDTSDLLRFKRSQVRRMRFRHLRSLSTYETSDSWFPLIRPICSRVLSPCDLQFRLSFQG